MAIKGKWFSWGSSQQYGPSCSTLKRLNDSQATGIREKDVRLLQDRWESKKVAAGGNIRLLSNRIDWRKRLNVNGKIVTPKKFTTTKCDRRLTLRSARQTKSLFKCSEFVMQRKCFTHILFIPSSKLKNKVFSWNLLEKMRKKKIWFLKCLNEALKQSK